MNSSKVTVCLKLEELVVLLLRARGEASDMTSVIEMAAARMSRGKEPIVNQRDEADTNVL